MFMNLVTEKIKTLCKDKNITLQELSERSGITIEQFELMDGSDKIPSLSWLIKISRGLGVRLGTFLDDYQEIGPIINRQNERDNVATFSSQLSSDNAHLDFYALAARKSGRYFEPFIIDINPSKEPTNETSSSHEGEEFIYVIEGSITIQYGTETHVLQQGDSIYYDSIVPHLINPANGKKAKVLAVVYSPM